METKDIILELREKAGFSQEELAEKIYVTRQAVSRWENGETTPNTETLKLLSKLFEVSINTLLGSPQKMVCRCCGMPLDGSGTCGEENGEFNGEFCKWCYAELPKLDYWKEHGGCCSEEEFAEFRQKIIDEFNALQIEGMPKVENLNALEGSFINMEYKFPNGESVKFLDDEATYLGNQLENKMPGGRCFGIAANMSLLLVCSYEENGENPELIVYKKR